MKKLYFEYSMNLEFDTPVQKHSFTLKCVPKSDLRQRISGLTVHVFPNQYTSTAKDTYGNHAIYGYAEGFHDHFAFRVTGFAETGLASSQPLSGTLPLALFRYQTRLTAPGPAIRALAEKAHTDHDVTPLSKALTFMETLYANFTYMPGVTDFSTTAEQAMQLGKGVCQDYSHILLSLCRMEGIPCRYTVGMLIGEGASHAWVEICQNDHWFAIDPTNHQVVKDQHIKISSGRDCTDCTVNQGVFTGFAKQKQSIVVHVEETVADTAQQCAK